MEKCKFRNKMTVIIEVLLICIGLGQLISGDSYFIVYGMILVLSVCSVIDNYRKNIFICINKKQKYSLTVSVFSFILSCMITLANYKLWSDNVTDLWGPRFKFIYGFLVFLVIISGSFLAFWNLLIMISLNTKMFVWKNTSDKQKPALYFWISFLVISVSRLLLLFGCEYPGEFSCDSFAQMIQINANAITNHHPYLHTMLLKWCYMQGMSWFGNINAGMAIYCVIQTLFMSFCFSFAVSSLVHMKTSIYIVVLTFVFFLLMPYHIIYSITIWKDVLFGGFVLLFVLAFYRVYFNLGNKYLLWILLLLSSVGVCLMRSNGLFAFVLLTVSLIVLWRIKNKRIIVAFVLAIIISFTFKHFLLAQLNVPQPDLIESLSIPAQQVSRVVYDECELSEWEKDTIEDVIELGYIKEKYTCYTSDPIKEIIRFEGNQQMIAEYKLKYAKLYLTLGLKHPFEYIKAWTDETCGYWNSGYDFWRWYTEVWPNDIGVERVINIRFLDRVLDEYLSLFTSVQFLRLLVSVGLFVWIDIVALMVSIVRKDKVGIFVTLPVIYIVLSLLVATPVFVEFRYIYAAFCVMPIVLTVVLRPITDNGDTKQSVEEH